MKTLPTYHGLHITTTGIARVSIFDLPHKYVVMCSRSAGWELRLNVEDTVVAGELDKNGLILDIDGAVICDSLTAGIEPTCAT